MLTETRATYEALLEAKPPAPSQFPVCTVDHYHGPLDAQGRFHGRGVAASCMGFTYEGTFTHGQIDDQGAMRWLNQYTTEGAFRDGVANGMGRITWPNGDVYEGNLLNGVRHGQGSFISHQGKAIYEGEWAHSKRHGVGCQRYPNGCVYEGDWDLDRRHGMGMLTYENGDCYEGEWRDGLRHGHGVMGWRQGTPHYLETYDGEWHQGVQQGDGKSTYIRVLDPSMAPDEMKPKNYAPPVRSVMNAYHGSYVNGVREGTGRFYYGDGSCYDGEWRCGKKNGRGQFTNSVGTSFYSMFVEDVPQDIPDLPELSGNSALVPETFIADLCSMNDGSTEHMLATIQSLLLRFNTALKALFNTYANSSSDVAFAFTPQDWWKHRVPGHIGVPQLLRFFSDAKVLNGPITISTVIRCVVTVIDVEAEHNIDPLRGDYSVEQARAVKRDVYRLQGHLNYRQFCEATVRLAPLVCVGSRFRTLGEKFNALVEEFLKAPLDRCPLCPVSRSLQEKISPFIDSLERLFNRMVDLELTHERRLLPSYRAVSLLEPTMRKYGCDVVETIDAMMPFNKFPEQGSIPPGYNQPQRDLSVEVFEKGCGPRSSLLVAGVTVYLELTLVDFVEIIVTLASLVTAKCEDCSFAQFMEEDMLALKP